MPGAIQAPAMTVPNQGQRLSSDAQPWLRAAINEGNFPELRWPDFSDYSRHINKFYELNGYSLWWTNAREPTPQARQMIALFQQSDLKGLSQDDYDGPRWHGRMGKLKPLTQQPTELDAAKFDLALTVCAMRYISDLHIGKVNPKRVAFFIDDESKKYDLAEFLKDNVVNAPGVSGALAQIEPPFPGYRHTVQALQKYVQFAKDVRDESEIPIRADQVWGIARCLPGFEVYSLPQSAAGMKARPSPI